MPILRPLLLILMMIVALILSPGCRTESDVDPTPTSAAEQPATRAVPETGEVVQATAVGDRTLEEAAEEAALAATGGETLSGVVTVMAPWVGTEQDDFLAMVRPFQRATGISVVYEGTRNLNQTLHFRIREGDPPHLAGIPGPGQMEEFVRQALLTDLEPIMAETAYREQYAPEWIELGTIDGQFSGVFIRANLKGLIWYNPQVWEKRGLEEPESWDGLIDLSQGLAGQAAAPWCLGLESDATSGWPGTDWLESILLHQFGPEVYKAWHRGELAWTSPEIRSAWEKWALIAGNPEEMVYGGRFVMLDQFFGEAGDPLFRSPPGCYMLHQGNFITDFFLTNNPTLEPGEDFDFFPFPPFEPGTPERAMVAGDAFGMFIDTPEARALLRYLVTPEAQAIWAQRGSALSPNQTMPLEHYPDDVSRQLAEKLITADTLHFDASDLMPRVMNRAFFRAVIMYAEDPSNLDNILEQLDVVRTAAYR